MYIFFHGVIFDPTELIAVGAGKEGIWLILRGTDAPIRIRGEQPETLVGELYRHMLEAGIAFSPETDLDFEMDEDEEAALSMALSSGYEYLARDKGGGIYAYRSKPRKLKSTYEDPLTQDPMKLEKDWFSEIRFETGAVSIAYLLS